MANKRIQKKRNDTTIIRVRDYDGVKLTVYIKRKFWNRGSKAAGYLLHSTTGDYMSLSYIGTFRYSWIAQLDKCLRCDVTFLKSPDNRNRIYVSKK